MPWTWENWRTLLKVNSLTLLRVQGDEYISLEGREGRTYGSVEYGRERMFWPPVTKVPRVKSATVALVWATHLRNHINVSK